MEQTQEQNLNEVIYKRPQPLPEKKVYDDDEERLDE